MPKHNFTTCARGLPVSGLLLFILLLAVLPGCARTQMQRIVPHVSNMVIAHHYFGKPTASMELADGTVRHEWVLDRVFQQPGGLETRRIYVGHDRDGYREYIEEEVYVPPWKEQQYCRLVIIANKDGAVLQADWDGYTCDELPRVKVSP